MQVPEYVVSLYVATSGQNGLGLGSDEKEIILLVYVILEVSTGKIVGTKQILVRPDGNLAKDRTLSQSSDTPNAATSQSFAITYTDSSNASNNGSVANAAVPPNAGSGDSNTSINNSINPSNSNAAMPFSNRPPTSSSPTPMITATTEIIELPLAHTAGKPLKEAIAEFDEYLLSMFPLTEGKIANIAVITDGQLPMRQCLHREACVKDVALPNYYNKFCDLRKEFLKYKSGDLSRALVPVKDVKKILQMSTLPPAPQSISEMIKDLNIINTEDTEFYVKESRDMATVVQTLLESGHTFHANEIVNLILEPGICSIDDVIDGNCIVRARGLPWQSSDQDIAKFFRGLNVAKGGVALCLSPLGRRNGEALIRFQSQEHRDMALKRHKHHIGNRYIEVYRATGDDFLSVAGGASNEAQAFLSKGAQVIIRMRGLPYDCVAKQVLEFFTTGDNPCSVLDGNEGVLFVKKPDGRATGDAFVLFANESDAPKALARHRESIGQRYIELFRSTTAEVQQVLNRSLDPKTYEPNQQPPLIAQLPAMHVSLLPQHLITSGITKNCIRLRGLPYEALVEHILHFLDDFAKHIIYQGVHMVINAQGQPSGEAFIQMDTEDSARLCAQRKHNHFMVFGKKYRYIEVFQCSGDDMNMVLNGGLQSPVAAHHAHHSSGKHALLSPGAAAVIGPPFGAFAHFGPPAPVLTTHPRTHHAHTAPHAPAHTAAAFYPHPFVYWSYPTPPVSPTTYFSQPGHTPVSPQHQAMYSLDFMTAVTPGSYGSQAPPLSPPSVNIPPSPPLNTAGIILSPTKAPQTVAVISPKQFSSLPPVTSSMSQQLLLSADAAAARPLTITTNVEAPYCNKVPAALVHAMSQSQLSLPHQHKANSVYHFNAATLEAEKLSKTLLTIDAAHADQKLASSQSQSAAAAAVAKIASDCTLIATAPNNICNTSTSAISQLPHQSFKVG